MTDVTIVVDGASFSVDLTEDMFIKIGHDRTNGNVKILTAARNEKHTSKSLMKQVALLRDPDTKKTVGNLVSESVSKYMADCDQVTSDSPVLRSISKQLKLLNRSPAKDSNDRLVHMLAEVLHKLDSSDPPVEKTVEPETPEPTFSMCCHESCSHPSTVLADTGEPSGFCSKHLARVKKHASPYIVKRITQTDPPTCTWEGCTSVGKQNGAGHCLCTDHSLRFYRESPL
jgi:hypothetical protein